MDIAVLLLQGAPHELDKPRQRQLLRREPAPAAVRHLREAPPQLQPHIQQDETQRDQYEAVGWIAGRRPAAHRPRAAIATFNAEAPPIEPPSLVGRQLEVEQDEELGNIPVYRVTVLNITEELL